MVSVDHQRDQLVPIDVLIAGIKISQNPAVRITSLIRDRNMRLSSSKVGTSSDVIADGRWLTLFLGDDRRQQVASRYL